MRPSTKYYAVIVIVLAIFLLLGYWLGGNTTVADAVMRGIQQLVDFDEGPLSIFLDIFLNNSIKALGITLFGFLFFLPITFFVIGNGLIIGIVVRVVWDEGGTVSLLAAGFLPHGITEFAAFLIASAYSLWLSIHFIRKLRFGDPFKPYFMAAMRVFLIWVLPLILVSALIETYITPVVMSWV